MKSSRFAKRLLPPAIKRLFSTTRSTKTSEFKKIGIVGCGTIGTSWSLQFLLKGYEVQAFDVDDSIKPRILNYFKQYEETLSKSGLPPQKIDLSKFKLSSSFTDLNDVDFVQESGPERLEVKKALLKEVEKVVRPDVIISSSSSSLMPTEFQEGSRHPERFLLGHPFNPPHIIPLVEVCGGKQTSAAAVEKAKALYDALGKSTIVMKKEVKGHIANRFQAAIFREALALLQEDVATAEDLDIALTDGPGIRWAIYGVFMNFHLGGGPGGLENFMKSLAPAFLAAAADLRTLDDLRPETVADAIKGVNGAKQKLHIDDRGLQLVRDQLTLEILAEKSKKLLDAKS